MTDLVDITVAYEERDKDLRAATSKYEIVQAYVDFLKREELYVLGEIESLEDAHRRRIEPLREELASLRLQREQLDA